MGVVRFLLALSVAVAHATVLENAGLLFGVRFMSAVSAVQAFYVISGFLITMVLNERAAYSNVVKFYLSRYLRLWPACRPGAQR